MRSTITAIAGRLGHFDTADMDVFGLDFDVACAIDAVDQSGREGILHSVDDADLVHEISTPARRNPHRTPAASIWRVCK
jgi:hypothetical protein